MSDQPTCGKKARNRYGEIHCDNPPNHEGDCDFGSLPVTAREEQAHCNDCGHAPHVGRVCDYGAAHGFEHDGCKCGPEDQPRPTPQCEHIHALLNTGYKVRCELVPGHAGDHCFTMQASEAQGAAPQMDVGGSDAFHDWPQAGAQPPQDARTRLDSAKGNIICPKCYNIVQVTLAEQVRAAYSQGLSDGRARSTPSPQDCRDDGQLADQLAPLLWEADDWWEANKQKLVPEADWAESLWLHMLPQVRQILGSTPSPDRLEKKQTKV